MTYEELRPSEELKRYIDAYWMVSGTVANECTTRIIPDGCVDLIVNLGDDCRVRNGKDVLQYGRSYLVGAMTSFADNSISGNARLFGIRFRPGSFASFFSFASLHEIKDQTIEFKSALTANSGNLIPSVIPLLESQLISIIKPGNDPLAQVMDQIYKSKGNIGVETLAKSCFITTRKLERDFKKLVGLSPKQFLNIVRFRNALSRIKTIKPSETLLEIALDTGFYDHSHLAEDIHRYTGHTPSDC